MQEEQQCDAQNDSNPAKCARFVTESDDCYEKVICPTEWKIKAECLKKSANNPEVRPDLNINYYKMKLI
jgi:hypothetical protein